MSWDDYCQTCGGTGEKFDKETDDWAKPIENCPKCKGTGLANEDGPSSE